MNATKIKTPALTDERAGATAIRLMGEAGPLRMFSEMAFSGGMSYESPTRQGFARVLMFAIPAYSLAMVFTGQVITGYAIPARQR
jgi:hypothetical protein